MEIFTLSLPNYNFRYLVLITVQLYGRRQPLFRSRLLFGHDSDWTVLPFESFSCCYCIRIHQILESRGADRGSKHEG